MGWDWIYYGVERACIIWGNKMFFTINTGTFSYIATSYTLNNKLENTTKPSFLSRTRMLVLSLMAFVSFHLSWSSIQLLTAGM